MKEEPKDIKSIFSEAIEKKDAEERAAYLDKACGNNAALRAKVEALLKAHQQAGSFLNAPPFDPNVTLDTSPLTEGPGTIIGRYKLLEQIGEGGFGVVYMAEQQEPIRRRVALKIIKLGMDTKQVIARFEAERQALAMMDHPNIAGVLDAGATETGRPYFVMELVKGIPITEYCDKNNLDTQQRLELFIDVCKAVQHAHQKGIIHRDIKPSNVMITLHDGKPVPKVIDFGIAKATSHRLTEKTLFTKYAQMIGTPEYMSPEQAEMSGLDIDTRTDIYSLGVLLYELLTSATPFDAKELREAGYIQMQRIIRETEPLRPSTKLNTMGDALTDIAKHRQSSPALLPKLVRGDLDWIAMKTLEKDRTRRYETANELAMDIQRHLSNEPVEASPPSTLYRVRKLVQKHRRTVAAVITIAAILVIGLLISTTMYFVANRARRSEAVARTQAEQAKVLAEQAKNAEQEQRKLAETKAEDLRRSSYVNSIQLADASYREGNIRRVHELLDSCPNDLRGWEWNRINYISDQAYKTIHGRDGTWSIALSPNGRHVASGGSGGTIALWDTSSGTEILTFAAHEGWVHRVAFSPDGKRIVSGGDDKLVKVWDSTSGNELMSLSGHNNMIFSVAFSPDGKKIVSSSCEDRTDSVPERLTGTGQIKVWDAVTGEELLSLQEDSTFPCVKFSPDSSRIITVTRSGGSNRSNMIKVFDAATGCKLMTLQGHKESVYTVAFSPDGKRIASGSYDEKIKLWDTQTGKELLTLSGHKGQVFSVAFSPNGKYLASGSGDQTIRVWDVTTGTKLMTLQGHEAGVTSVAFSPDGEQIVSGSWDNTIKLWDVPQKPKVTVLRGHDEFVSCVTFSSDGKTLVSGSHDKTIKFWDLATHKEIMILRGHENKVRSLAFSPDGTRLASGSTGGIFKVWDIATGKEVMSQEVQKGEINSICFSPDGKNIFVGGGEGIVRGYDVANGKEVATLTGLEKYVWCVGFSPDGKYIVSCAEEGMVKIWDANTKVEVMTLQSRIDDYHTVYSIAFSPNAKQIVTGGAVTKVWDLATGNELMTLGRDGDFVGSVSFTPDSKRIIAGCRNVKIWDAETGAEVMTLGEAEGSLWPISISPDGRTIAAGCSDNRIILWESAARSGG